MTNRSTYPIFYVVSILALAIIPPTFAILPDNVTLTIPDVTSDGIDDHLVLTKRSVRAPGMKVYEYDGVSYTEIAAPEVRTYRGYVQEDPSLQVNATIEPGDVLQANITDGRAGVRFEDINVTIGSGGTADPGTGNTVVSLSQDRTSPTPRGYVIPKHTMRRYHIGVTVAPDYHAYFGSVEAAVARMEQRVNDADHFYARDMGIAWEIQEIVVCTGTEEGNWEGWWSDQHTYINSKIFFKAPGGAGSSGNIFSASNVNNQHTCTAGSTSQYARSLGHEVGHGYGAGHNSSWGDIMGGSESCLGVGTVQRMIDHADIALEAASPKLIYGAELAPHAMEDGANVDAGQTVDIDVLDNDYDGNGDAISLAYVESPTSKGGTVRNLGGGIVRYTPPANYLGEDTFVYHVADAGGIKNRNGYVKVYVRNNDLATHIVFDETSGTLASDIGPYQAHGTLTDDLSFATSTSGKIGSALQCNSDNDKESADFYGTGDPMDGDLSVSLWVKYPLAPTLANVLISKGGAVLPSRFPSPRGGWVIGHLEGTGFRFTGNMQRDSWQNTERFDRTSTSPIQSNTWYHLVMVLDRTDKVIRAWVNNSEITNSEHGTFVPDGMIESSHRPLVVFDAEGQQDQKIDTPCIIDDVRIYNKVLSSQDISDLYAANGEIPAGAPDPASPSNDAIAEQPLSWMPGKPSGYDFDVYLGTNYKAVLNATTESPEYMGQQSETTYTPSTASNTHYYWRIDEVGSTVVRGDVWSFYTGDTLGFVNKSFEDPAFGGEFGDETTDYGINDWWDAAGYVYTQSEVASNIPLTPYGENWAELGNNRWMYQQAGTWQPNKTYDISFLAGQRSNSDFTKVYVSLLVGGNPANADDENVKYNIENPLETEVGATLITTSAEISPFASSDKATSEVSLQLSTGTGHTAGDPLWLQIHKSTATGRALLDNIKMVEYSGDVTVPTPNPMAFSIDPFSDSETEVSMAATTASDASGVEYYFTCTTGGGNDSGWQVSSNYTDTGLTHSTTYSYTVMARDLSSNHNETIASPPRSVTTVDNMAPTPDPMTFASPPTATGLSSISMTATAYDASGVEYYFTCTAGGGHDSGWQESATYEDTGLTRNTQYTYTVTARDLSPNQNATAASPEASATTDPPSLFASCDMGDSVIAGMLLDALNAVTLHATWDWSNANVDTSIIADSSSSDHGLLFDSESNVTGRYLDFDLDADVDFSDRTVTCSFDMAKSRGGTAKGVTVYGYGPQTSVVFQVYINCDGGKKTTVWLDPDQSTSTGIEIIQINNDVDYDPTAMTPFTITLDPDNTGSELTYDVGTYSGSGGFLTAERQISRIRFEITGTSNKSQGFWLDNVVVQTLTDADADGMPDAWETQYFTNGLAALPEGNADGDAFDNLSEFIAGTDPTNAGSVFQIENHAAAGTNGYVIEWDTVSNRFYRVGWTNALGSSFQILTNNIEFPRNSYTDTVHHAEDQGFYRVDVRLK